MKSFSKLSVDEKVSAVETRLKNALAHPDIMAGLAAFGIDNTYVDSALLLVEEARQKSEVQKKEYSEQYEATNRFHQKLDEVEGAYNQTTGIAGLVFDDESTASALKLNTPLPGAVDKKIERMRSFYSTLLLKEEYSTALARFLRTVEMLTAEKNGVEELAALRQAQTKETGEAQLATQARNKSLEQLSAKDREFCKLLKLAFGTRNELLEVAGIFVRS